MKPAVFQGSYCDLKFIRTRGCAQVIIEIPLEAASAFVEAFGAPCPSAEVSVAIARIDLKATVHETPSNDPAPKERRRLEDMPLAQQAGIHSNDPKFWRFLSEEYPYGDVVNADQAAATIRDICDINSRAELATNDKAAGRFVGLVSEFQAWMRVPV